MRKFDASVADERAAMARAVEEREGEARKAREAESRVMQLMKKMEALGTRLQTKRKKIPLQTSTKDDDGKSRVDLERQKRRLEEEVAQLRDQVLCGGCRRKEKDDRGSNWKMRRKQQRISARDWR